MIIQKNTISGLTLEPMTSSVMDLEAGLQCQAGILCGVGLKSSEKSGLLSHKSHTTITLVSTVAWQEDILVCRVRYWARAFMSFFLQQPVKQVWES